MATELQNWSRHDRLRMPSNFRSRYSSRGALCHSFDDLQMDTGVSTCCGRCEDCAREVYTQAKVATGMWRSC